MQYCYKYANEDQILSVKPSEIVGDNYFDHHGVLQNGYATIWEIKNVALLALLEWGFTNPAFGMKQKMRMRFSHTKTRFMYEFQTLLTMIRWDRFSIQFKARVLNDMIKKRGTTMEELFKTAA